MQPTQIEYLDRDIIDKLTAMLARQWEDPRPFVELVSAYAAMRQVKMLDDIGGQLTCLWGALDDIRQTLVAGLPFDEDPLTFEKEEEKDDGPKQ
jgi:hypothetical protein